MGNAMKSVKMAMLQGPHQRLPLGPASPRMSLSVPNALGVAPSVSKLNIANRHCL